MPPLVAVDQAYVPGRDASVPLPSLFLVLVLALVLVLVLVLALVLVLVVLVLVLFLFLALPAGERKEERYPQTRRSVQTGLDSG